MRGLSDGNLGQPFIAANAMFHMDDQIAGREGGEFGEEGVRALLAFGAADEPVSEHILFGQEREGRSGEPVIEGQGDERGAFRRRSAKRLLPALHQRNIRHPMIAEQPGQPVSRANRIAGEDQAFTAVRQSLAMARECIIDIVAFGPFGGEIAGSIDAEIEHDRAFGFAERSREVDGFVRNCGIPFRR